MAWTTPRTWQAGETVTSSMLNAHIRDNLNYLKSAADGVSALIGTRYLKSADQTITSTTGLTDITVIQHSLAASKKYYFEFILFFITAVGSDYIKLTVTGPASPTSLRWGSQHIAAGDAAQCWDTWAGGILIPQQNNPASAESIHIWGYVENGANAGALKAQFAQYTSFAGNTTIYKNSWLVVQEVA